MIHFQKQKMKEYQKKYRKARKLNNKQNVRCYYKSINSHDNIKKWTKFLKKL